jgi:HSP20 family protein
VSCIRQNDCFFETEINLQRHKKKQFMMTLKHHTNALIDSPILSSPFFKSLFSENASDGKSYFTPAANVFEHEASFEIVMALPGFDKQAIQLDFTNGILTIKGEHQTQSQAQGSKVLRKELHFDAFKRQYRFEHIQSNAITAKFDNGLLSVVLPKQTSVAANKIAVQ